METIERIDQIKEDYLNGKIDASTAKTELNWLLNENKKAKKAMDKTEKKELAHRIIKIILEVLLQIITMGLPALLSGGKTLFNHKK